MQTSRPRPTLATLARRFEDASSPKLNGWTVSPAHPPCVCIKPSDIPIYEKIFDDQREEEKHCTESGSTLWFVIYQDEPQLRYGFLLSPSSRTQPTTRLDEMGVESAPSTTSGGK